MDERKILVFISFFVVYCLYCLSNWFRSEHIEEELLPNLHDTKVIHAAVEEVTVKINKKLETKTNTVPLFLYNACSVLEVFTEKPIMIKKFKARPKDLDSSSNTIAVIGITVFLVALAINAVLDVLKVKEEERERRKLNPDGERRQSLAEFANKKQLKRESSRFGFQLFQITESVVTNSTGEEKASKRQIRPYTRGDSTNSYLADKKAKTDGSTPTETSEPRLVKRQSVAKLFGARPVPMVRRSSFPALPINPDVQALMLGHRQLSCDSDDEDGRGRRVRIIRRY